MAVPAALTVPMDVSGTDAFDASVPLSSLVGMQPGQGMMVNHHQGLAHHPGLMVPGVMMAPLGPVHLYGHAHATAGVAVAAVATASGQAMDGGIEAAKGKKVRKAKVEATAAADAGKKPRKRKADVQVPLKATLSVQEPLAKKRRRKDKDAPKKPRSAYIVFLDRHREEVRKACPDMQMKNITAALAKQWKHVTEEELANCKQIAMEERAAYDTRKKTYEEAKAARPPESAVPEGKPKVRRAKKDKDAPKKGRSAFILFLMDFRGSNKQTNNSVEAFADVSKSVGQAWAKLSTEERAPYLERARKEAAEYEGAKKEYLDKKQARLESGEPLSVKPKKKEKKVRVPLEINMDLVPTVSGVDPSAAPRREMPPPSALQANAPAVMGTIDAMGHPA